MADTHARGHSYHLVDPSPWPAVGSVGALVTAFGLVFYMHDVTPWLLVIGSAILELSLIHITEPTRLGRSSYAVVCLKK